MNTRSMKLRLRFWVISLLTISILSSSSILYASSDETVKHRQIKIDLGDEMVTEAELTLPAIGEGPFPGVLLIPGGGTPDMDEYMPPYVTVSGQPARPHLQLAEYLSERGFAVLRYNKRGIGFNSTLDDPQAYFDTTIEDLIEDAEKALEVLRSQAEVDPDDITLIGHSESTIIAPRIAANHQCVLKIVLMGTAGRSYYDIKYFKTVELRVRLAEEVLDQDDDGKISVSEVVQGLEDSPKASISLTDLMEQASGTWRWLAPWDTDGDGYMNIENEFRSTLTRIFEYAMTAEYPGSKLVQSHLALASNIDTIGNVTCSVLILQGTNDILTPIEDALLLEQKLTSNNHPDHTLITYPGLGHYFCPEDYYSIAMGPMETIVLEDLETWLKDSTRRINAITNQLNTTESKIIELQGSDESITKLPQQISELNSKTTSTQDKVMQLEASITHTTNLMLTAVGLTTITTIISLALFIKNRVRD